MPQTMRLSILGFAGGFLAVLIFHQSLWFLFNLIGLIPPERPAWPFDPIPPFGVPSVLSKAFWGGLWGAVLAQLLSTLRGRTYWASWILVGAVALSLVAFFVVPPIKGEPIPSFGRASPRRSCSTAPGASARRCSCGLPALHETRSPASTDALFAVNSRHADGLKEHLL